MIGFALFPFSLVFILKAYVEDQVWQIGAIKEGVRQADQGKFASDDKVRKTFAKFGVDIDQD